MTVLDNNAPIREGDEVVNEALSTAQFLEGEEKICREMLAKLSESEMETAAKSSYSYMQKSLEGKSSSEEREFHAMAMALRYLRNEKGDQISAMETMNQTIAFREETDVDGLRRCFYELEHPVEATTNRYDMYRSNIREQLSTSKSYIRGYDKKGRALFNIIPRRNNSDDPEWYLKGYVYMVERALACTERNTGGAESKVIVLFDYSGYKSSNAPPVSLTKKLLFILRDHYPECLEHVFILDAPLAFRVFWMLIRPFIDPATKSRVLFLTGVEAKTDKLGGLIEEDQAELFMLPGGTMQSDIKMEEFLSSISFDKAASDA